jgi:hypothetical protein
MAGAARLRPMTAPAMAATTSVSSAAAPMQETKQSLSAEAQWHRVSAVVERSIERAQDIGAQQAAARQQLDAAEYTLHRLIEELNEVMTAPVQLPKRDDASVLTAEPTFVQSLAA